MFTVGGFQQTILYPTSDFFHVYHNDEPENLGYATHWHTSLEIITPISNIFSVIIDEQTIVLNENDILIIAPGTIHTIIAPTSGQRDVILFEYSTFLNISGMKSIMQLFSPCLLITSNHNSNSYNTLRSILQKIIGEFDQPSTLSDATVYMYFLNFFITLSHSENSNKKSHFPGIQMQKQNEYLEKMTAASNFISEHCTEDISIDDIAFSTGFSKSHFMKLFKQFIGLSCYDYLIKQRIAYATSLLCIPELTINYIAMQSGFNSLPTFNRVFKAEKGCSPTEYRKLKS